MSLLSSEMTKEKMLKELETIGFFDKWRSKIRAEINNSMEFISEIRNEAEMCFENNMHSNEMFWKRIGESERIPSSKLKQMMTEELNNSEIMKKLVKTIENTVWKEMNEGIAEDVREVWRNYGNEEERKKIIDRNMAEEKRFNEMIESERLKMEKLEKLKKESEDRKRVDEEEEEEKMRIKKLKKSAINGGLTADVLRVVTDSDKKTTSGFILSEKSPSLTSPYSLTEFFKLRK